MSLNHLNARATVTDAAKKPAYKEPWFWAVFSPLIVIFGVCVVLLRFAIVGSDDRVTGDYYKQGRMINNRFEAQHNAERLGVAGDLSFDEQQKKAVLLLRGQSQPSHVLVTVSHPAKAAMDFTLNMQKVEVNSDAQASTYASVLQQPVNGRRYIVINGYFMDDTLESEEGFVNKERNTKAKEWRVNTEVNFDHSPNVSFDAAHPSSG